jgi:hypothetical protein
MSETRRQLLQKLAALTVVSCSKGALATPLSGVLKEPYRVKVNCAGPAADGFSADRPYKKGQWGYIHGGQYFKCESVVNDYGLPEALTTLRYSCGAPFHYKFDVPNGHYRITMYFVSPNELYGQRKFDVVVNRKIVLADFHPFPVNTGFKKQFDDIAVRDGQIDLTFRSINDACLVNAIEVEQTSSTPPPKPVAKSVAGRTSHDDLIVSYYGDWTVEKDSHAAEIPGSAMDFSFRGPKIKWIGVTGPDCGMAEVYLDGVLQQAVDAYASGSASNQVLFEKSGLSGDKYHTVRILISRDKNPKSTGRSQHVSAFEAQEAFDAAENDAESAFREITIMEAGKKPYIAPADWRPVCNAAEPPQNGVTLQSGVLRTAFERNVAYQINNWEMNSSWTNWLPGANEGRRLMAAANILRWAENPALREKLEQLVTAIAARQRSDGYALPYSDSDMGKVVYGANNERMPYDRRNFTLGILAAAQQNPTALEVARKFQDWLYASPYINTMLDGALGIMGEQPNLSMYFSGAGKEADVIAGERFWRQDWWLAQLKDQQPIAISRFPLNRAHSYASAPWITYCDSYRATGDPKYIDAMLGAWQVYHDNFVHVGGSAAICEDSDNAYPSKSYYLDKHTGENCGGALWIDFNHRLLQLYPDHERFAAEIEQTLLNVTLANQDAAGNIRYHTNLVGKKDEAKAICTCCEVTNTALMARLPEFVYSKAADGVFVNLFSTSSLAWKQDGKDVTLHTRSEFPEDTNVSIKIATDAPLAFKIRLRIPSWAVADVPVMVNGAQVATGKPGSYVTLARTWSSNDHITFALPIGFRMTKYTGFDRDANFDRYALQYGPLLMPLVGETHLNIAPDELVKNLLPVPDKPLHYGVAGHLSARFMPYLQIQDETFTSFPTIG